MSKIVGTRLVVWSLGKTDEYILAYHPYRIVNHKFHDEEVAVAGRLGDGHTHFADEVVYKTHTDAFNAKVEKIKSGELREYKK